MGEYKKIALKNSEVYLYKTNKYKRCIFKVAFEFDYKEIKPYCLQFLGILLTEANKDFNNPADLSKYEDELYGVNIYSNLLVEGETIRFLITCSYLSETYTEKDNDEKIYKLVSDLIYKPFIVNGKFDKEYFKLRLEMLKNFIMVSKEKKENYAYDKVARMFEGTPYLLNQCLFEKEINKINQEEILDTYEKLLKAPIHFYIAGDVKEDKISDYLTRYFLLENKPAKFKYTYDVDLKKEPIVERNKNYAQSLIVSIYKIGTHYGSDEFFKSNFLNIVLKNKLFNNVREKRGLCYSIYSVYSSDSGTIVVVAGIDYKQYKKCLRIIDKQIDDLQKGKITKKEYKTAKEYILGTLTSNQDELSDAINSYLNRYHTTNKLTSMEDLYNNYQKVTIEDITKLSQKIENLTHYFLKGVGSNE